MLDCCGFAGQVFGHKFCGGIGFHSIKGRPRFSVASVATEVSSVEQVRKGYSSF